MTDPENFTREMWQEIIQAGEAGVQRERQRILDLIKYYWCGDANCKEHTTNWPHLIESIKATK
jgi:hypothetical protein